MRRDDALQIEYKRSKSVNLSLVVKLNNIGTITFVPASSESLMADAFPSGIVDEFAVGASYPSQNMQTETGDRAPHHGRQLSRRTYLSPFLEFLVE